MDRLGPFGQRPHLAVGVSGGSDSLALGLLCAEWAKARGARVTCLTVDHGLRAQSAVEARQVALWLRARAIPHEILCWAGGISRGNLQARARLGRYALLRDWCRRHGVLHLAIAHHLEDQAETVLLREERGSGIFGLAGMAAAAEMGPCRIIRPLLSLERARLGATLARFEQSWINDPSNENSAFRRVAIRVSLRGEAEKSRTLAEAARRHGKNRREEDRTFNQLAARALILHPAGFVRYDPTIWPGGLDLETAAAHSLRCRLLGRILATIGDLSYPPRYASLERVVQSLSRHGEAQDRRAATLGGCRLVWAGDHVLIFRETASLPPPVPLHSGSRWDRFVVEMTGSTEAEWSIGALGDLSAWHPGKDALAFLMAVSKDLSVPKCVWPSLPALRHKDRVVSIPHLRWETFPHPMGLRICLRPNRPITEPEFIIA